MPLLLIVSASPAPPKKGLKDGKEDLDLDPTSRVIHGTPVTSKTEYEFVVDLAKDPDHISSSRFCTGTLIRPDIVLTAAHWYVSRSSAEIREGQV